MIYLTLVTLLWAFSFGLIGSTLKGVDPYFIATFRLGTALLVFLPFLRVRCISLKDTLYLMLYGAVEFGLMYVFYIKAFQYLPSHLVALFTVLTPIYVVLIHDLRKRKVTRHYIVAAIISVLGATIIKAKELPEASIWTGFVLMQLSGLAFAYGQVAYRDWKIRHPSLQDKNVFAWLYLGGATCALTFSVSATDYTQLHLDATQWSALIYLGSIASGIGFFLWNKGAALSNAGTLAVFNNALVPVAMIVSLFLFREISDTTPETLIRLALGAACIGYAVWMTLRKRST